MTQQRYTITTALPYANGPLHLGHVAGVYIPADIYVRYLRAKNEDVIFIGGTDEHGVPITIKAKNEGVTPQQVVDKYHNIIGDSLKQLGITLDVFSKTTSKTHFETASELFRRVADEKSDNWALTIEETLQYYDEANKQFLADRYITGTCPNCGNEKAYGDQCEKCGTTLNATDLINPKSTLSGNVPVLKLTRHWFLPLNQYEDWLKTWILEDHQDWKTNVYGQCKGWLEAGLHPRAVTRDLDWGIPVPVEGGEGKVLYVWFDAPIGYISFTKELLENDKTRKWEDYWKEEGKSKLIHFIGKDNIVFHCIIFPTMLKAFNDDYILPTNVPANEFLNLEGEKFSTSGNWAVWLHEFLLDFPDKTDVLRYALCSNMPETKDADFTWKDFQAKNNNELAANLGNFVNRAFVLTHKFFNGAVPAYSVVEEIDANTLALAKEFHGKVSESLDKFRFREALSELMKLSNLGNKYLADTEPWKIKDNPERVGTILRVALEIAAKISVLGSPFLPETSKKMATWLGVASTKWSEAEKDDLLTDGFVIATPELLFAKIEDDVIAAQLEKLKASKATAQQAKSTVMPQKENVSFEEFSKMDIRIGTIIEAEKVPKTAKLLKLKIDTGIDQRTVVSGIAEYYSPEDIIGKQVSILVNLAPRNIKGIESQGMILMAENSKGELAFVSPVKEIDNGGGVR